MKSLRIDTLPDQEAIVKRWRGGHASPEVSICCITFNHGLYIEEALISFLLQDIEMSFEIVVSDDASSDDTPLILKAYEEKYPLIFNVLYQTENRYSQGDSPSVAHTYPRARGDIIAFCEGDDYWLAPSKLRLQIDELLANPDVDLCFHRCVKVFEAGLGSNSVMANYGEVPKLFSSAEVASRGGGFIPSPTVVFRRAALDRLFEFYDIYRPIVAGDYLLQTVASERGGALYLPLIGSAYRQGNSGSWSTRFNSDSKFAFEWWRKLLRQVGNMKCFFREPIAAGINVYFSNLLLGISRSDKIYVTHKLRIYKEFGSSLTIGRRAIFLACTFIFNKFVHSVFFRKIFSVKE